MLTQLHIKNLILIDSLTICFEKGFNVITGETGSGKSAIMSALRLITGVRSDYGMIRQGEEKAVVEASFTVEGLTELAALLEKSGIDHEVGHELILKREVSTNGKGRAFINNQMAQISLLKKVGELLVDIVGQHDNQKLFHTEEHRRIIDTFGDALVQVNLFQKALHETESIRSKLEGLIQNESERLREIEICQSTLNELDEAAIQEGEEDELFSEYSILTNAEELGEKAQRLYSLLSDSESSVLPLLNREKGAFERLATIDITLKTPLESYHTALLELEEASLSLRNYLGSIDSNPLRAQVINERLTLINKIKKKYGPTLEKVREYHEATRKRLDRLENADFEIEGLQSELIAKQQVCDDLAKGLSELRIQAAKTFQKAITNELRDLNMPKAEFEARIIPQKRTQLGDEKIEFFIAPNVGERMVPVKECASGGEISRMLLALQTILASKEKVTTILFDEVDANIGGETAVTVGQKLKAIGESHQVLCITHFPQVAKQAAHHLQIAKVERDERTITVVTSLNKRSKKIELDRMLGNTVETEAQTYLCMSR